MPGEKLGEVCLVPLLNLARTRREHLGPCPVDQRGLPKLLEHGYARPQVLRVAHRLGTNNQRPKAGGTFIDVQLKGAFQYPTSSRGPEGCYKSVNCNVQLSTASPLRILR